MKIQTVLSAAFLAGLLSLPVPASAADSTTPAVNTSRENNPAAPVAGENSFTESQVRERLQDAGYSDIGPLSLDAQGIWRTTGKKDSVTKKLAFDFQGNITSE